MTLTNVFVETQFPPDISYNSRGGPGFSTTIFTSTSGREQRNINWSRSRAQYDASDAIKTKDDMDVILAFFYSMMGKAYAFRYKDWADFQLINQQIGVGDGTTAVFQFIKTYSDPLNLQTFVRPIKKPVVGSVGTCYLSGVPLTSGIVVDYTTGLMTFVTPPPLHATVVVGYAEFDVPVRFDTDMADIRQDFYQVESWESIKLVEVKL
jgi:uncharacterized protein (TIGR02217 family)